MMKKLRNDIVTVSILEYRTQKLKNAGYNKPKWIEFCEYFLGQGYTLNIYEAKKTFSKYITVSKEGKTPFKVRFSNHLPIKHLELKGSCDFFVGVTNLRVTNTAMAIKATEDHFNK